MQELSVRERDTFHCSSCSCWCGRCGRGGGGGGDVRASAFSSADSHRGLAIVKIRRRHICPRGRAELRCRMGKPASHRPTRSAELAELDAALAVPCCCCCCCCCCSSSSSSSSSSYCCCRCCSFCGKSILRFCLCCYYVLRRMCVLAPKSAARGSALVLVHAQHHAMCFPL